MRTSTPVLELLSLVRIAFFLNDNDIFLKIKIIFKMALNVKLKSKDFFLEFKLENNTNILI